MSIDVQSALRGDHWPRLARVVLVVASLVLAQPLAAAGADYDATPPGAAAMGVDVVLVRPLSLVATTLGTGLFVVSLPFSALGLNTDEAAGRLVGEPAKFTFLRPLGEFETATTAATSR